MLMAWNLSFAISFAQYGGSYSQNEIEGALDQLSYHALLIGIDDYSSGIPELETSVNDAKSVGRILVKKYGFPKENIIELYNKDASRKKILRTLREMSIALGDKDALVIYFAGHGVEDPATGFGYWIPADSSPNEYDSHIPNSDIRRYLRAINARHIFLVSDSCFSGTFLAQRSVPSQNDERFYAKKAAKRSRIILTSGGKEPVLDKGKSGHSIFGYFFLEILRDYDKPYLTPTQIYASIGPLVGNNAPQTPQWGSLREAMDEGGEIVLRNYDFSSPAMLFFDSKETCAVYLNDRYIGNTPITSFKTRAGSYSYKMNCAESRSAFQGNFRVSSGEQKRISDSQKTNPTKNPGFLSIVTRPWVSIEIDGKDYGYSPLIDLMLNPGAHRLHLRNSAARIDHAFEIIIEENKRIKIGPAPTNVLK